jgi:hypothetical protein
LLFEDRQGEQRVRRGEEPGGDGMGPLCRVLPDEQHAAGISRP